MAILPLWFVLCESFQSTKTAIVSRTSDGITDASTGTRTFRRFLHEPTWHGFMSLLTLTLEGSMRFGLLSTLATNSVIERRIRILGRNWHKKKQA